ncbi:hypothetical protein QCA50_012971 [Cerrena zonata]|uniref:Pre-rRNA-processing protein IPI3 n=1 Tax=Cerrena zonata TaxID=2478898 RepID=A0AAW0G4L6_9APHY
MEEVAFFIAEGNPADKHSQESVAFVSSFQTPQQYASFRQADCPRHGAALTGVGPGERLFTTSKSKALLNVYSWGKGIDQRIAVPEQLECLSLVSHPSANNGGDLKESGGNNLPLFRVPWLLAGGSKSGRIYIWELALGNLLCVKDAHYQGISVIKFSDCGTFLVSGGEDARVMKVEATASLHKSLNKTKDEEDKPISVTCLDISMDGTSLISGDSADKKHRLIPPFKRVLASSKPSEHVLNLEIPADLTIKEESFDDWLNNKAQEELQFKNLGSIDSSITLTSVPRTNDDSARIQDLESKLAAVSEAYTDLRSQHEKLIDHYSKKD